ncbi:ATP-dependent DNA helicase [Mycena chlorophos]|uniref:ATP-dependent DNA helicase n=1 Tax=Mycena chlorophos TaxID=658473 RepID=A0A8H6W5X3_MYCCL|nr:ATP-dependent DNA helicase [Mycena chlorophos]
MPPYARWFASFVHATSSPRLLSSASRKICQTRTFYGRHIRIPTTNSSATFCFIHPLSRSAAPHYLCRECHAQLVRCDRPRLSLANNLWVGEIPFELAVLDLAERLLIGLYFPAVYVIKLFPKTHYGKKLPENTLASGVRGNVSTYRLGTNEIAEMIAGKCMPRPAGILSALIAVTFVGFKRLPLRILAKEFRFVVIVYDALVWLKAHNPLYADIEISQERLEALPEHAVPPEIELNARYSEDEDLVLREHAGYVPFHPDTDVMDNIDETPSEEGITAESQNEQQHFDRLGPASPKQPGGDPVDYGKFPPLACGV